MPLNFKSLCSSSSGNCLLLWTKNTRVIIDCGLSSMKRTEQILTNHLGSPANADVVIFTHMHGDHCSYYPLRVLQENGLTIKLHENSVEQLREKHWNGNLYKNLKIKPFDDNEFNVGELFFSPFEVSHHPGYKTYGFVVRYKENNLWKKVVIVTDFNNSRNIISHFIDAAFIFVESNHDLELLRQYPNPNSYYHMSNSKTADLLCLAGKQSKKSPQSVMLGHISHERNEASIALRETRDTFKKTGLKLDFEICTAPLYEGSEVVSVK